MNIVSPHRFENYRRESGAVLVALPRSVAPVLALGAFLKNTLSMTQGAQALVTPDVGNLDTPTALRALEAHAETLVALAKAGGADIEAVAHDLHPDFHSSRYGMALADALGVEAVAVQHHHAHVAAVLAEHGVVAPALGLALDGFGLGPGNEAWGGELLLVEPAGYRRLGHLSPLRQPGGDRAAREPWRMAAAALFALGRGGEIERFFGNRPGAGVIAQMLERGVNAPATTSCGRLFDAACGLLGVIPVARFEGEAPMCLEAMVRHTRVEPDGWRLDDGVLDMRPLLERLIGREPQEGAELFHGTLAAALADWTIQSTARTGVRRVVLSGGCFLNRVLRQDLKSRLAAADIDVMSPIALAPGDTAISLGQAWAVAMARE